MPAAKKATATAVGQVVEDNAIVIMAVGAQTDVNLGVRSVQDAAQYLNEAYFANGYRIQDTHLAKVRDSGAAYVTDLVYILVKDAD